MRDPRIHASAEEVAHSLQGNWREDVLFELKQVVDSYDFYQKQIAACEQQLQKYLAVLPNGKVAEVTSPQGSGKQKRRKPKSRRKNEPNFNLEAELHRLFGVDLTRIDGIDVVTAQVILSELGTDLSAFANEGAFSSWLELAPRRDITGAKSSSRSRARARTG